QHHKLKHGCYTFEFSCLKIFTTGKIKIEKAHILPLVMSMGFLITTLLIIFIFIGNIFSAFFTRQFP
ncbi:hypothetical protein, partial [[Clostridium] scindens]|uniref:hypothetical protein n=1 Tax=Clostridium scindens (strain JCM 10418 / VPI 12708) TaxID=29347 RepID=UPI001A9C0234